MNDVGDVLLQPGDFNDMLGLVARRARDLLGADLALIVLAEVDDDASLVIRVADGLHAQDLIGSTLPSDHSVAGIAMRDRDPVLVVDGSTDPRVFRPAGWPENIGATLVVPLYVRAKAVGTMTVARVQGKPMFLTADIDFVKALAEKATFAVALAKSDELNERERLLRATATRSAAELERQQEMVDRMAAAGRARNEILGKVAHELRAPLTSVIGYTEVLAEQVQDPEQQRMLATVERNGRRLASLVDDLLTMSLVDAGILHLDLSRVVVGTVVEHVRDTVASSVAAAELQLTLDLGADVIVKADAEKLERAVLNLVTNAVKFTLPGGRVEVTTRLVGDEFAEVAVADTGSGIPFEEQEHLFTRFFRATQVQERQVPGIGLGLYIVKQIVELHDGVLDVVSTPAGTVFTMRLPVEGPAR